MEGKDHSKVDRDPRQVEECRRPEPRQEGAHVVEIAKWLEPVTAVRNSQRQTYEARVNASTQASVE